MTGITGITCDESVMFLLWLLSRYQQHHSSIPRSVPDHISCIGCTGPVNFGGSEGSGEGSTELVCFSPELTNYTRYCKVCLEDLELCKMCQHPLTVGLKQPDLYETVAC